MKKFITYLVFIALLIIIALKLYSGIIDIGLKLRQTSPYVEIIFYVLSGFLFYVLILNPVLVVMFSPYYSIAKYCDDSEGNNQGIRRKAYRLIKYGKLEDEEISKLKEAINDHSKDGNTRLSQRMYIIYNNQIKKNIDKLVIESSRDTLVLTAVSQSRFVDMLTVLVNNFRLLKNIVIMCGFRPTFIRTLKLYINIFATSLVADGIQQVELSSLISTSISGTAKLLTDSAMNGVVNGFFMLRIGMLTKNYLYAEDPVKFKATIRNNSYMEAVKLFPSMIASLITSPIKGITSLFKQNDKKEEDDSEEIPGVKWERKKRTE